MSRQKRSSKVLEKAERRLQGLMAIDPSLDLGNGLTLPGFRDQVLDLQQKLAQYNTLLSTLDAALNDVIAREKELADLSERMLTGVAAKFGKDSNEYEMAGGTRKSERKRPTVTASSSSAS